MDKAKLQFLFDGFLLGVAAPMFLFDPKGLRRAIDKVFDNSRNDSSDSIDGVSIKYATPLDAEMHRFNTLYWHNWNKNLPEELKELHVKHR